MQKKLPPTAIIWKQSFTPNGAFLFTSDKTRDKYTLWRKTESGFEKMKSSKDPMVLEKSIEHLWETSPKKGVRNER